jgi:hypothetical protein
VVKRRKVVGIQHRREGGRKKRGDSGWTWWERLKSDQLTVGSIIRLRSKSGRKKKETSDLSALTQSRKVPSGGPRRSALPAGERIERTKILGENKRKN